MNSSKKQLRIPIKTFKAGELLFSEGDLGHEMFIIKDGSISIRKHSGSESIELTQLSKGSILGEMSLIDHGTRSASAISLEKTQATVINQFAFEQVMRLLPVWLGVIIKIVVQRIRETNKKVDQSLSKHPHLSLAFYLFRTLRRMKLDTKVNEIEIFHAQDEFSLLTRLTNDQFRQAIETLSKFGLIKSKKMTTGAAFYQFLMRN